ncbi:ETS translocation variant 4-like isoform X2 [Actinia tenebrosa]|nr:ETS translocation variant 4-like isoform X2 [Actinia tenebrosa]XP_031571233.1 ETS translocation variant 4-like isoform X2 [Actinia tenebrosa]
MVDSSKKPRYKNTVHLWEFLLELLSDERYNSIIAWSRKDHGEFKLKNQEEVAKRWGILKHRAGMNYEKLSRAIRYYYQQGIIQKVPGQRLVYKFGQLPYEFKPRINRLKAKTESTSRVPFQETLKAESPAFLPLTSLTPPPEAGYSYPVLPNLTRPICNCCYDNRFSPCTVGKLQGSPLIFPSISNGYTLPFTTVSHLQPHISSPPRAIPVSVITSTRS